jgi:hypothetical protein
MAAEEEEMLDLAVANGVKVIALTRHSDCAAEKVVKDPALREKTQRSSRASRWCGTSWRAPPSLRRAPRVNCS